LKVNVYIDGFNLYYGAVKGTPYKWLDVACLCRAMQPNDTINRIRYFTALVEPRPQNPEQLNRQRTFIRALLTIPNLSVHYGHFLSHVVTMYLAPPQNGFAKVIKTEEKGSDVNLATHLLADGFRNDYEVAIVVTNDSDLAEPIQIVRDELKKPVGVLSPHKQSPSVTLRNTATFFKSIRETTLRKCQFPETLTDSHGSFSKPSTW
jgi:NYN domain